MTDLDEICHSGKCGLCCFFYDGLGVNEAVVLDLGGEQRNPCIHLDIRIDETSGLIDSMLCSIYEKRPPFCMQQPVNNHCYPIFEKEPVIRINEAAYSLPEIFTDYLRERWGWSLITK